MLLPSKVARRASLGFGVPILDGIRIGEGAIVGVGAIVTKGVAPRIDFAGVPARGV